MYAIESCEKLGQFPRAYLDRRGWSRGARVLGELPVPGHLTKLDDSSARAYCAYSRYGRGHMFFRLSFLFFLPLSWRRYDID